LIIIQDYVEKIIELHSLIMSSEDNSPHKKEVENLKKAARKLRDRSFLFSELITDEDDLVLEIGEISAKFYYEARDLDNLTKQEVIMSSESGSLVDRFETEIATSRQHVKAYYLYKKKF